MDSGEKDLQYIFYALSEAMCVEKFRKVFVELIKSRNLRLGTL